MLKKWYKRLSLTSHSAVLQREVFEILVMEGKVHGPATDRLHVDFGKGGKWNINSKNISLEKWGALLPGGFTASKASYIYICYSKWRQGRSDCISSSVVWRSPVHLEPVSSWDFRSPSRALHWSMSMFNNYHWQTARELIGKNDPDSKVALGISPV